MKVETLAIKLLIAILGIELRNLKGKWLGVANLLETFVVNLIRSSFDSVPFLTLVASSHYRFEL
jgi:hypothetical protein